MNYIYYDSEELKKLNFVISKSTSKLQRSFFYHIVNSFLIHTKKYKRNSYEKNYWIFLIEIWDSRIREFTKNKRYRPNFLDIEYILPSSLNPFVPTKYRINISCQLNSKKIPEGIILNE